jgi:hypothetical protein
MGGAVMVIVAETDFVWSAVDVAVTVTVLLLGTALGAVYVMGLPLLVWAGLKDPQSPTQVRDQSTPTFEASFETTAVSVADVPTCTDEGGVPVNAIVMGGLDEPPQAATPQITAMQARRRIDFWSLIAGLPSR